MGALLGGWGSPGGGDGQFQNAAGLAVDSRGSVYVVESYPNDRVQVFSEAKPPPTISEVAEEVTDMGLPHGIENSLQAKLLSIQRGLEGDGRGACLALNAFAAELSALSGKQVPAEDAGRLVGDASEAVASPRCAPAPPSGCRLP